MAAVLVLPSLHAQIIDLSRSWRVALDRQAVGEREHWFARDAGIPIALPGSLPQAGLGDPITAQTTWTGGIVDRSYFTAPEYAPYREPGNVKVPFWLQPETHYVGSAWYQREFDVPADWSSRRVILRLERPHWKTTVWVDETRIGSNDSLSGPHQYELGARLAAGHHRLTIRVDNRHEPDIGENSHSISDHTQGNWNGIVGQIALIATPTTWIEDLQVYPRLGDRSVLVHGRVRSIDVPTSPAAVPGIVQLAVRDLGPGARPRPGPSIDARVGPDGNFTGTIPLGANAPLWDEFTPVLHRLTATLPNGDSQTATFGLREFREEGHQFLINGRPVFLRGTLDCAAYPRTGHPPMDEASWRRVMQVVKDYGLNHIRFHSWCPPEAAFVVADSLGLYLQVEVPTWPNQSTTLGDGKPVDAWIERETARILALYGNHPSFVMLCAGNEPGGKHFAPWLSRWVAHQKADDPRRLYTSGSGWPELPENDYHVTPEPRIQQWGAGLASRINANPPETRTDYHAFVSARHVPVVSHEIGQWCAYPNFGEMPKYTGYLKPRNFEIFQHTLAAHGMAHQAHDFLIASGKLQALCYREEIESALRTAGMGGFQLLGLSDFPGQGTALVGVLDAFWEEKGYVTANEFRHFCGSTVPLARLSQRVFTTDERLVADVEVAHYGQSRIARATSHWRLLNDQGATVAQGAFDDAPLEVGARNLLGHIDVSLAGISAPARYHLAVTVAPADAAMGSFDNAWDVWVYPSIHTPAPATPTGVTISSSLDTAAQHAIETGGILWLALPASHIAPDPVRGPIALGFSSIFWNTAWTSGQAPHTLGILCDPKHPALAAFPTDGWSNWQWWYPITHAAPMRLDDLPRELTPTVQVIDDWVTNRKLGLIFEARCGKARVLVTSIDLPEKASDPVRRQLRVSLLAYLASREFRPVVEVTAAQLRGLTRE